MSHPTTTTTTLTMRFPSVGTALSSVLFTSSHTRIRFLPRPSPVPLQRHTTRAMPLSSTSLPREIEIEQKFVLTDQGTDALESRLESLGLERQASIVMTDWYYDTVDLWLTPQDCWMRYRAAGDGTDDVNDPTNRGSWQLKLGQCVDHDNSNDNDKTTTTTTVYEELQGNDAIDRVAKFLSERKKDDSSMEATSLSSNTELDDHISPSLPEQLGNLIPFARIVTTRSSWVLPTNELRVDLDRADHGYTVGEVETVVQSKEEIPAGQERVRVFLEQLQVPQGEKGPVVGKLEDYLRRFRPEHYKACIQGGSMVG